MVPKDRVFKILTQIPRGKVVTYKQVALLAEVGPRVVGNYLHQNTNPIKYPCHRVIHSDGSLSAGYVFGGEGKQLELLQKEGVEFCKKKVNLRVSLLTKFDLR